MKKIDIELSRKTEVMEIIHDDADIYIICDEQPDANYFYGGTRIVNWDAELLQLDELLKRLMLYESKIKNQLINIAIRSNLLSSYAEQLPKEFLDSVVGGARCIIKPRNQEIAAILNNRKNVEFYIKITKIFDLIGQVLNKENGRIKLTPDFGRFADLSDILAKFTPHVLGVSTKNGGCGGKSSYTTTGIIAAIERTKLSKLKETNITLIGSAGELGSDMLRYFIREEFKSIAVCDLVYDAGNFSNYAQFADLSVLPSQAGKFTDTCLRRGGIIVTTTVGEELENSNWQIIPPGTFLFLAHNLAIPPSQNGIKLMRTIAELDIIVIPGQLLTLGGALTSRLEWFWRQSNPGQVFNKRLANTIVRDVVSFWIDKIMDTANVLEITPYEAMLYCLGINILD
ncbi:MAG: hypothetical protein RM022_004940 [Nostoc sp. EfeVER01]|uniref:hypothetical protein n=1 Tax=unclassified Nostoc TaxID=2593658 RepID=UPI002AD4B4E2|nr:MULTISPECIES: hypothetical protein [unclassified Nostoc]MDZ7947836.1 hypothetical protein [Nostoc sp. EfeVER01]MDZ7994366.1 hypothetical protein [Nostoc sp. EspVER01]